MAKQRIKVFVIEDEFFTRDSLRIFLSQDPRTTYIGGASKPDEAIRFLNDCGPDKKPDVILLDMQFRATDGSMSVKGLDLIEEITNLKEKGKIDSKILCLSLNIETDLILAALSHGTNGYLDKNQAAEGIIDAIMLADEGRFVISQNIAKKVWGSVRDTDEEPFFPFPKRQNSPLSTRTEQVAYLYYRCGMSAKEIANELYIEESTVRTHLKKVKLELKAKDRSETIQKLTKRIDH